MLIYFTDAQSKAPIAINPKYVCSIFTSTDGDLKGKTFIIMTSGNLAVDESELDVFGAINGILNTSGCCK